MRHNPRSQVRIEENPTVEVERDSVMFFCFVLS